jgi:hypothetical protein
MPAGILTICSWSLTPKIWRSSARRIASTGTRCPVRTSGSTPGQGHEFAGHAFGRTNGGFGRRWAEPKPAIQAPPDKPANPAARLVDVVPSSSALSPARSWDDATQSWEPAGCSPGQLTPMGGLVRLRAVRPPLGLDSVTRPDTRRHGASPSVWRLCLLESQPSAAGHAENLAYSRKAHCKRGHPLQGANLRIDPRTGARICRECSAEHQRAFRERLAPRKRPR